MKSSIGKEDVYILFFAIFAAILFAIVLGFSISLHKRNQYWREKKNEPFSRFCFMLLSPLYTIALTVTSLFPLLGMFGTVRSLLNLNIGNGEFAGITDNFFGALTSTAWGIVFSIIFKFLNSCIQDYVEAQLDECRKLSDEQPAITNEVNSR